MAASIHINRQALRPLIPVALIAFLVLPITLWAILQPTRTRFKAAPISFPITNPLSPPIYINPDLDGDGDIDVIDLLYAISRHSNIYTFNQVFKAIP